MKKRSRKVLHANKDFESTRNIPAQARAALNDSNSRLPTTTAKRVAAPRAISSSPTRAVAERPVGTAAKPPKHILLVLPRPDSPTGSVYAEGDEEMASLMLELTDLFQTCPQPAVQKVRSSSSDKALVSKHPSRGRHRLPPVPSAANLDATRNSSTLHKSFDALGEESPERQYHAQPKAKQPPPRTIVSDYSDKPSRQQQSRASARVSESRRSDSYFVDRKLPQVAPRPQKTPSRERVLI